MQKYNSNILKFLAGTLVVAQVLGASSYVYAAELTTNKPTVTTAAKPTTTQAPVAPQVQKKAQSVKPAPKASKEKATPLVQEYQTVELIATAYYSPLPNQKYYLRGNYEAEIRLNGNGTHGASGKAVFVGMLAAPKSYSFGTKIWIEGLGIGSVEDRGGAIVNKWVRGYDSDRVDIWMGSGDEGLARALAWGKRKVKARIYASPATKVSFSVASVRPANLAKSSARVASNTTGSKTTATKTAAGSTVKPVAGTAKATSWAQAATVTPKTSQAAALTASVAVAPVDELELKIQAYNREVKRVQGILDSIGTPAIGDVGPEIRVLQEVLIELGYMKTKSTAIYGEATKQAVLEFQKDATLIIDAKDPNGGVFGKLTREKLAEKIVYEGIEI